MPVKPTDSEQEYFARLEAERLKQRAETKQLEAAKAAAEPQKPAHYMKCPRCGGDLLEIEYETLKLDRCVGCQGIWLDPGELEQVAALKPSSLQRVFSMFKM